MIAAVIVAAGAGKRFGEKKQFVRIAGKSLLSYALAPFMGNRRIEKIVLVVPPGVTRADLEGLPLARKSRLSLVTGGRRRQDSVYEGLKELPGENGIVLVHDGVRPLTSEMLLATLIAEAEKGHAVVPVVPVSDTLKEVLEGKVVKTLERERIFCVQTPQAFPIPLIRRAHENAREKGLTSTDDAQLVEALGVPVHALPGDPVNIKVTTREDLALVSLLLQERNSMA
jgi:2-C-methyl-D-erythritol 4-phosphate cytidylyltransferase